MDAGLGPAEIREMLNLDDPPSSGYVFELGDMVSGGANSSPAHGSGGAGCLDDIEDVVYLAEAYGMVEYLETHTDGSVKAVGFFPASEDRDVDLRECAAAA